MTVAITKACTACGSPITTRRNTLRPTCSHKCYMQLRRAEEKSKPLTVEEMQSFVSRNYLQKTVSEMAAILNVSEAVIKVLQSAAAFADNFDAAAPDSTDSTGMHSI